MEVSRQKEARSHDHSSTLIVWLHAIRRHANGVHLSAIWENTALVQWIRCESHTIESHNDITAIGCSLNYTTRPTVQLEWYTSHSENYFTECENTSNSIVPQAFEQFWAVFMHSFDDKHPSHPGFSIPVNEPSTVENTVLGTLNKIPRLKLNDWRSNN